MEIRDQGFGPVPVSNSEMRKYIKLVEAMIIHDRAVSDVDGKLRDLVIFRNPSVAEAESLLRRSLDGAMRGFIRDRGDDIGTVVIWDAFLTDHAGAESLLREHGYGEWWPRFVVQKDEFFQGIIRIYIDHGMEMEDWEKLPKEHLRRMLGQDPTFIPE